MKHMYSTHKEFHTEVGDLVSRLGHVNLKLDKRKKTTTLNSR